MIIFAYNAKELIENLILENVSVNKDTTIITKISIAKVRLYSKISKLKTLSMFFNKFLTFLLYFCYFLLFLAFFCSHYNFFRMS